MVRKLPMICAVAAALLFPVTTFAKEHHGHDKHNQGHAQKHNQGHDHKHNQGHAQKHNQGHDHGHHRHWYHGRWWDYGVGRCWRWTPVGAIWICGDGDYDDDYDYGDDY
jgi:ABC-type Zn2+ transport system substrate-binding protein/surface adhesin